MEYGFDKTFLTDEDLEQSMDDFIEAISQELEDEEWNTTVLVSKNLSKFSSLILF